MIDLSEIPVLTAELMLMGAAAAISAMVGLWLYLTLSKTVAAERTIREKVLEKHAAQRRKQEDRFARRVSRYFEKAQSEAGDVGLDRLHRAGFYGRQALTVFYTVKYVLICAAFAVAFLFATALLPLPLAAVAGLLAAAIAFILPTFWLEHRARNNLRAYRRTFPDFMDMMIVCADAGLSLEAAIARVSRELGQNSPELGLHLEVMTLEMRAGRTMREALHGLARRTGLPEAKTLAVLFQQSEELGTSLVSALRVYSEEMRQRRITAAEERANALPIKMLLPLGGFVFPVILIVVLLPIMVRLTSVL